MSTQFESEMPVSCCVWALDGHVVDPVQALSEIGFHYIDIRATDFAQDGERPQLPVNCVGLSFGIPDGYRIDDLDSERASETGRFIRTALEHTVWAQASTAYVVPGFETDDASLSRFAGHLVHLADQASELDIKVCIEHFPGRGLPTISATLDLIRSIGHPNLYLLLDIGHAQMSGENPIRAIEDSGERLGYVHFDDNDCEEDLHLGLCDGVMSEDTVSGIIRALFDAGYTNGISLELNVGLEDPIAALRQSLDILVRNSDGRL